MKKRKQHIIPKCYLDNFVDENGRIHVLRDDKIFAALPGASLVENHFYTITLDGGGGSYVVEDTLANIEGSYIQIYRDKISKFSDLTNEERARVSIFIAAMQLRTRVVRDSITKFIADSRAIADHIESLSEENKAQIANMWTPSDDDNLFPIPEITDAPDVHNRALLANIQDIATYIFDMQWSLVYVDQCSFLTSDNPVAVINPPLVEKFGFGTLGSAPGLAQRDVEVSMPLSSSISLFASWKTPPARVVPANQGLTDLLNSRTVMYRQHELIARGPALLERWASLMDQA